MPAAEHTADHVEHPLHQPHPERPVVVPEVPHQPDQPEVPKPTEQAFDQYKDVHDEKPDESPYVVKQAARPKTDQVMTDDVGKSALQVKVEEVMANGLDASYQTMTPVQQERFRKKGEEIAKQIEDLTARFKLTARKVLHLLRSWLKLIPGINKFFLEQEAKLKADAIMKLGQEEMLKRKVG